MVLSLKTSVASCGAIKSILRALKGQMSKEWKSQLQPVALGQCPSGSDQEEGQQEAGWLMAEDAPCACSTGPYMRQDNEER